MWFLLWENAARKGGRFRLAKTRATHFDKKRAWNANCVQTQFDRKGGRFRLAETRATHFDKKRAWNANCVQTQSGGGDGGIRTHVPISGQNDFESFSLRPLRYISIFCSAQISRETHLPHHSSLIIITKTPLSVNRFSSVPLHAGMHRAFLFCIITKPASAARRSLADAGFCF